MPHQKKPRLLDDRCVSAGDLSVDVLANILGYLDGPKDVMQKRRVCKKWGEAVKKTIIPPTDFCIDSMDSYNAVRVMARAMPNLQQIELGALGHRHKWSDGEDANEWAGTANWAAHDIEVISNFSKLRILEIDSKTMIGTRLPLLLNGRYPFLFNSFPLLHKLRISHCYYLKWDLEMLAGFPLLKELYCWQNRSLTGNISSLRVLKDTLEKVKIFSCENVEGKFMDLADFPRLKKLDLYKTAVTGDIRDIGENDFSSLEQLILPMGVYGGFDYEVQRISDAPDLVRSVYLLKKQRPALNMEGWYGVLSDSSPDSYVSMDGDTPPIYINFVEAGPRIGYRWTNCYGANPCEVNWLDPEPDRESSDYEEYTKELQRIKGQVHTYRGFHQPPIEEEYRRLYREY